MRETRQSGSEGGGAHALPTPILVQYKLLCMLNSSASAKEIRTGTRKRPAARFNTNLSASHPSLNIASVLIAVGAGRYHHPSRAARLGTPVRSRFRIRRPACRTLCLRRNARIERFVYCSL
jgi:hypothetical protein